MSLAKENCCRKKEKVLSHTMYHFQSMHVGMNLQKNSQNLGGAEPAYSSIANQSFIQVCKHKKDIKNTFPRTCCGFFALLSFLF
jgi:hypothetical protein